MSELTLEQETALKVRELQIRFDAFETENKISGNYFNEFDEELEEGRVSLEKLEKRVRELETDLPELIAERVATLKTENAELRVHLNLVIDTVNNIVKIWNEQIHEDQSKAVDGDGEQSIEDNEVVTLLQGDDEPRQLTLEEVYNMYQSQPQTEEEWEEMTNAIKAAVMYENSLPNGTKIRLADETSGSPQ